MPDNPSSSTLGDAIQWDDTELARLIGLNENSEPANAILISVLNDAGKYPDLFGMITANVNSPAS